MDCWKRKHREYAKTPHGREMARLRNLGWRARYIRLRASARKRGLLFDITPDYYQSLEGLPCTYCGYEVVGMGHGIDRVDVTKAYTPDNVVRCCIECNQAKNDFFTFEEMKRIGKLIAEIRRDRRLSGARAAREPKPNRVSS